MQKTYIATRINGRPVVKVQLDGNLIVDLSPRWDLANHSPDGYEWGYEGSGPSQLALAICADVLDDDLKALRLYQLFKRDVIAALPREGFTIVDDWILGMLRLYDSIAGKPSAKLGCDDDESIVQ